MEAQRRLAEAAAAARERAEAEAEKEAEFVKETARRRAIMEEKAALLLPEPPGDGSIPAITCLFRLPDGGRHTRRFPLDAPVLSLFNFVDSIGASGKLPGEYRLVTQYPRHVFEYPQETGETGLKIIEESTAETSTAEGPLLRDTPLTASSKQVLFLEPIV